MPYLLVCERKDYTKEELRFNTAIITHFAQ